MTTWTDRKHFSPRWYHRTDDTGSDFTRVYPKQALTLDLAGWSGPFETLHAAKLAAIEYHALNRDTANQNIRDIKDVKARDFV